MIILLFFAACSPPSGEREWWSLIPAESPLVLLFHDASVTEVFEDRRLLALEGLSDIHIESIRQIYERIDSPVRVRAAALYPTGIHQLQPVLYIEDPGAGLRTMARPFRKEFAENSYRFENRDVHILHLEERQLYATQIGDLIIMSRNSAAVENNIRVHKGEHPGIGATREEFTATDIKAASYLLNTTALENWLELLGAPRYLPRFKGLFSGTGPTLLSTDQDSFDDPLFDVRLHGSIPLTEVNDHRADPGADSGTDSAPDTFSEPGAASGVSSFVQTFAAQPRSFDLDRYIPVDAAFFAIFHQDPEQQALPSGSSSQVGPLDSLLLADDSLLEDARETLSPPTAFLTFEASGFLSVGEHMYLRRLADPAAFSRILRDLHRDGLIEETNNVYYVNSHFLGRLLGGPQSRLTDFYIMRSANVAVITKRSGLARRVDQDRRRRAVFYYDDDYIQIRERHPEEVSVWMYSRPEPLLNYLEPKLNPINHARFLGSLFDVGAASLVRNGNRLDLLMDTYFLEDRTEPLRDLWVFDLGGSRITGKPTLANIVGGAREEVLVATESNRVFGVAADGTGFLDASTANDRPVGSPMVYDWYGNNQHAVLVAAGNKIYAWNARGMPLPNFPVSLDEQIVTPLTLADVARDGRPEMIVATADRKVHVLDQRGRNIQGWPQDVNVQVSQKPVFHEFRGENSLWIVAGNGLFAFSPRGNLRERFPVFIESALGPVTFHNNHILAGAADGHLYAIGREPYFADSLVVPANGNSYAPENGDFTSRNGLHVRRVYVGNSPILNAPVVQTLTIDHNEGQRIRERMIAVQSQNGNLFLLNEAGNLRMTRNMGQDAADYDNILLTDLNGNGKTDMAGLTHTGRLYAWQVESGERVPDIPSASMRLPVSVDILGNGERELIGQTRDGLRCWSFRRP
ncbi:MAG: hypothetical protein R6U28_09280 [Cyclonatronaceae bacterium]